MIMLTYILAVVILIGVLKILTVPIKLIFKLVINSIIGGMILFFLAQIGIFIIISWWSIALVGILGIPGVIIAVILSGLL